jgi:excisionase family DNA binding protein
VNVNHLLTTQQVAEKLQVPRATIYGWRTRGEGPVGFRVGRHIRFRPEDVDAWIEQQRASAR